MAKRMTGASRRMAPALAGMAPPLLALAALAGCGPKQAAPEPIANIPAPLPDNIPLVEAPPPPPVLIGQHKGEDLWHLRSGLNVAVLLCQGSDNAAMVASYNRVLGAHRGLLAEAAQIEVDLHKATGGRKWQNVYDDHMTKVYNSYSGTLTRDAFCARSRALLTQAETATPLDFSQQATLMLWELNKAAGLPDPDGQLARSTASAAASPTGATGQTAATTGPSGTR